MAESDPTVHSTGTEEDEGSPTSPPASDTDGSTVSRQDYETAIAGERKRRSGLERAHRKEMGELRKELTDLRATLSDLKPQNAALDLPDLPANDPVTRHLEHIYSNMREWQTAVRSRDEALQRSARVQEAVQEAVSQGVPEDELDSGSVESIRTSAKEYLLMKSVRDLQAETRALRTELSKSGTIARAENGSLAVSTATGPGQPVEGPKTAQTQLEVLREEKLGFDRRAQSGSAEAQGLSLTSARAIHRVEAWIKETGGQQPMPKDWRPGTSAQTGRQRLST